MHQLNEELEKAKGQNQPESILIELQKEVQEQQCLVKDVMSEKITKDDFLERIGYNENLNLF